MIDLPTLLAQHGLSSLEAALSAMARPSIRLTALPIENGIVNSEDSKDSLPPGASRIGGWPNLPIGMSWPLASEEATKRIEGWGPATPDRSALPFLGQINLAEVKEHDVENRLPASGILSLFCDVETGFWRLLFHSEQSEILPPASFPGTLPLWKRYRPHRLVAQTEITLPLYAHHGTIGGERQPVFFDVLAPELEALELTATQNKAYWQVLVHLAAGSETEARQMQKHQMLGWPDYVQNPMKLDLQCVVEDLHVDGLTYMELTDETHPRTIALKARAEAADWQLILQIGPMDVPEDNMLWGDGGVFYVWLRGEDLRKRDFTQAQA